jgi:acetyl esterase/lipase
MRSSTPRALRAAIALAFVLTHPVVTAIVHAEEAAASTAALPPPPAPQNVPKPGAPTDGPYAPQPIIQGGIVIPLYPPDSPYLKAEKIREPEVYQMWGPTLLGAIVKIHNPSIEFHPGQTQLNTGAAIILAAGGGHNSLNVGSEGAPFVPFFYNHGVSTIILRNRLRSDGYDPRVDGVNDALQAIKLVRAYAKEWKLDPNKIGIVGFSAGAELAAYAAMQYEEFDRKNDVPGNPLAKISSRPDFQGIIYPGPSPFARGAKPTIPRAAPPAFIASAGWGDWIHAVWADEYFTALHNDGVPNVELHIYARGHHPGDKVGADEPPATGGLANMGGIAFGTWSARYLDWFRDLGFLNKPGVQTQAAKDVAAQLERKPRRMGPPPPPAAATPAAAPTPAPATTPAK